MSRGQTCQRCKVLRPCSTSRSDRSRARAEVFPVLPCSAVMSRAIFEAPMTSPASFLIGETVRETLISVPSFLRLIVSKCSIRWPRRIRARISVSSDVAFGRNQHCHWFADNLLRSEAENSLRAFVPAIDYSVKILTDNCIVRRLNDCRQAQHSDLGGIAKAIGFLPTPFHNRRALPRAIAA